MASYGSETKEYLLLFVPRVSIGPWFLATVNNLLSIDNYNLVKTAFYSVDSNFENKQASISRYSLFIAGHQKSRSWRAALK
ncbi:hypothetical protein B6A42_02630 [Vibrio coralliilyticus]|nr:hypothetical protein B6A42_02630 [Vibrio coralliilyticus]